MNSSTLPFFVQVFLRGGADGLTFVPPYNDPAYAGRNETLLSPPGTMGGSTYDALPLATSGTTPFGLAPALNPILPLFTSRNLAFVHAVGSKDETRSHFVQQDFVERGVTAATTPCTTTSFPPASGWLSRHLQQSLPTATLPALSIAQSPIATLRGWSAPATLTPESFDYRPEFTSPPGTGAADLAPLYASFPLAPPSPGGGTIAEDLVRDAVQRDIDAIAALSSLSTTSMRALGPSVPAYPDAGIGRQLRQAADIAYDPTTGCQVQIVTVDMGGWDTHADQGVRPGGRMYRNMDALAKALLSFQRDMENQSRPFCVLIMSEFGRTTVENSSNGTDHGRGGVAMIMAETGVITSGTGGLLHAPPGFALPLSDAMPATTDIRDLQYEILERFLGNTDPMCVMNSGNPEYTYTPLNILA